MKTIRIFVCYRTGKVSVGEQSDCDCIAVSSLAFTLRTGHLGCYEVCVYTEHPHTFTGAELDELFKKIEGMG